MKLLLADGDDDLTDIVAFTLVRRGYHVVTAYDGVSGLQRVHSERPDLLLLGMDLPRLGGIELCRQVRESMMTPVIMLGSADETSVVAAYESGADDYIVKPFSMRQLLLRLNAVARRIADRQSSVHDSRGVRVELGDLVIDPVAFEARKNAVVIGLTRLEFRILYCLARDAGRLVETRYLADYAWQSASGGDGTLLKTHLSHIRRKLAHAGGQPIDIRAVPRTGYVLSPTGDRTTADGQAVRREHMQERTFALMSVADRRSTAI